MLIDFHLRILIIIIRSRIFGFFEISKWLLFAVILIVIICLINILLMPHWIYLFINFLFWKFWLHILIQGFWIYLISKDKIRSLVNIESTAWLIIQKDLKYSEIRLINLCHHKIIRTDIYLIIFRSLLGNLLFNIHHAIRHSDKNFKSVNLLRHFVR